MNKIVKLEKRWRVYKAKKIISFLLFFSIFYAVGAVGYYALLNKDSINSFFLKKVAFKDVNISTTTEEKNISKEHVVEKEIVKKEENNRTLIEELSLMPIIPIIDMEKERKVRTSRPRHKEKVHSSGVKAKPSMYLTVSELSKVNKISNHTERDTTKLKKIHLYSSSRNYIETMKKKFLKSKNPRDALLVAKEFYREKNYKKSEKWALEANKLDSHLDESWILFAQSKVKNGKENEAIKILSMYYSKSKSAKVRAVIEKIKSGKL